MYAICPNDSNHKSFYTVATVQQDWLVDQNGNFNRADSECSQVIHKPNIDNTWTCAKCQAVAKVLDVKSLSLCDSTGHLEIIEWKKVNGGTYCRCPACGNAGEIMAAFSLLAAGFNGIEAGGPDDVDLQECGKCGARLAWNYIT